MNVCNDCNKDITEGFASLDGMVGTKLSFTPIGVYYDGPLICDKCGDKRKEAAMELPK